MWDFKQDTEYDGKGKLQCDLITNSVIVHNKPLALPLNWFNRVYWALFWSVMLCCNLLCYLILNKTSPFSTPSPTPLPDFLFTIYLQGGSSAVKCWGTGVLQDVRCIPIASQTYFWFHVSSEAPVVAPSLGQQPSQRVAVLPPWATHPPRLPPGLLPGSIQLPTFAMLAGNAATVRELNPNRQPSEWEAELLLDEKAKAWEAGHRPSLVGGNSSGEVLVEDGDAMRPVKRLRLNDVEVALLWTRSSAWKLTDSGCRTDTCYLREVERVVYRRGSLQEAQCNCYDPSCMGLKSTVYASLSQ